MIVCFVCTAVSCLVAPPADAPAHVARYLERCEALRTAAKIDPGEVAPLAPLPLPPKKDDLGVFVPPAADDARKGRSLDVLEVIDGQNAILRAWYVPAASPGLPPEDPTFVDLWVRGIDSEGLVAGTPVKLKHVFHVVGNKSFETTCGGRSVPLLEPIDVERYRTGAGR